MNYSETVFIFLEIGKVKTRLARSLSVTDIYGSDVPEKRKPKTSLPENFKVTDDHRRYCTDHWNYPYLADVFLDDFIECFELNGRKHVDWDRTFKNYIRNSSPSGQFYKPHYWQTKMEAARRLEYKEREKAAQPYHPRQVETRTDPLTAHARMSEVLRRLRA